MEEKRLSASVLESLPCVDEARVDELLARELERFRSKIVVLDDDPTGVQTVHDVSVFTGWDSESMDEAFAEPKRLFYILTNSRGLTAEESRALHREIADAVDAAAKRAGARYLIISRSDSTLRGHYPLETEVLRDRVEANTGSAIDGEVLCPFFKEGGRYTLDNIHYVRYGTELVPACETEFARDPTFGYRALTMPEYVEEKTAGAYRAQDVTCISLDDLRALALDRIVEQLESVGDFNKVVVNAADYVDVKVFCIALLRAMAHGKRYMFRTAAAFVKVLGGVPDKPLLTRDEMVSDDAAASGRGGIVVVGSHTDKTTRQVRQLEQVHGIDFVELDATLVRDPARFEAEVERCLEAERASIEAGRTVCCYTSRGLVTADTGDPEDELRLSVRISGAVQALVGRLGARPAFVVAKGGITSSDVGTKALAVRRATVLGQAAPGIPVWQTGAESTYPGLPYVIFPGNVGDDGTLRQVVEVLMG